MNATKQVLYIENTDKGTVTPAIAILAGSYAGYKAPVVGISGDSGGYTAGAYFKASGSAPYGVYAVGGTYAGYFSGDVTVSGVCDGSSTCNDDITEYVHSKASSENYKCEKTGDNGEGPEECKYANGFKPEFESGDVVCLDPENPKFIKRCDSAYDNHVLSVINYDATFSVGQGKPYPMSLSGNVPVKVICDIPIKPGDMLVTADKAGYAMKFDSDDENLTLKQSTGTIFAKATENCDSGEKIIRAWLSS